MKFYALMLGVAAVLLVTITNKDETPKTWTLTPGTTAEYVTLSDGKRSYSCNKIASVCKGGAALMETPEGFSFYVGSLELTCPAPSKAGASTCTGV